MDASLIPIGRVMAEINLTQAEADALIALEKHRVDDRSWQAPTIGGSVCIPLVSVDRKENFLLDLHKARIDLLRAKYQKRGRNVVVLVRIDLGGPPHRNPDDQEIATPHLHIYREGYSDKWAFPIPPEHFPNIADLSATLDDFITFCNITQPPYIEKGLF